MRHYHQAAPQAPEGAPVQRPRAREEGQAESSLRVLQEGVQLSKDNEGAHEKYAF